MCPVPPGYHHRELDPDPRDARAGEVRDALRGTLRDGELFVVFRAGAEVGAKRLDAPWLPSERGLEHTHPELHGRLLAIQGRVERGYGWAPFVGLWTGLIGALVLIQTGWLPQVIDAAHALDTMRSGWFYLAVLIFGGVVASALGDVLRARTLRRQLPELRALAEAHSFSEPGLLTRISTSNGLWTLQSKLLEQPKLWEADEVEPAWA